MRVVKVMYGKISSIIYNGEGVFRGLVNLFIVIRYYSLVVEFDLLLACFDVTVWSEIREIMGIRYR